LIASLQFRQHFAEKMVMIELQKGPFKGLKGSVFRRNIAAAQKMASDHHKCAKLNRWS
jgi:hypothetical protein